MAGQGGNPGPAYSLAQFLYFPGKREPSKQDLANQFPLFRIVPQADSQSRDGIPRRP